MYGTNLFLRRAPRVFPRPRCGCRDANVFSVLSRITQRTNLCVFCSSYHHMPLDTLLPLHTACTPTAEEKVNRRNTVAVTRKRKNGASETSHENAPQRNRSFGMEGEGRGVIGNRGSTPLFRQRGKTDLCNSVSHTHHVTSAGCSFPLGLHHWKFRPLPLTGEQTPYIPDLNFIGIPSTTDTPDVMREPSLLVAIESTKILIRKSVIKNKK